MVRWYALYQEGRLREEYDGMLIDEAEEARLSAEGVVLEDTSLRDWFASRDPARAAAAPGA